MKFACNSQELNNAAIKVQGAVETSTIPALQGILFSVRDGFLSMTGYNLETGITTQIKAHTEKEGAVVLDARRAVDIFKCLPSNVVSVETDEKNFCTIKSGDAVFSIVGMPAAEYPALPGLSDGVGFSFSRQLLKSMIRQTRFATAKTDIKPVHKGILFEIENGQIRLVAVDGYRLAFRTEKSHTDAGNMNFIVPEKTLSELIKLYGDDPGQIQIAVGKRHIMFEIDSYVVISRLLEGDFIDYRAAVPKTKVLVVKAETRKLIESVERMSLLITDRLKSPVRIVFDKDEIKTSCVTTIGNANDRIEAKCEGERVEIGFNGAYLLEALKASECDEIILELAGPLSPMKILPPQGDSFIFLVLPVRLASQ